MIFYYLTGAMSALVDNARADLWLVDNRTTNVNALGQIDVRVGRQVASLPGVARIYPLVVAGATARFPGGQERWADADRRPAPGLPRRAVERGRRIAHGDCSKRGRYRSTSSTGAF